MALVLGTLITGCTRFSSSNENNQALSSLPSENSNPLQTAFAVGLVGGLSGLVSTPAASYNLTSLGGSDWKHWGRGGTYANVDRKSSGENQISDVSTIGNGSFGAWTDASRSLSWSDGTPTASGTNDNGYIWSNANVSTAGATGFSFTVPAGLGLRTLTIYAGGNASTSQLSAHLSDGSSADFVAAPVSGAGVYTNLYTITYKAGSAGQTLLVTYKKTANSGSNTGGSADLIAAWLSAATATYSVTPSGANLTISPSSAQIVNAGDKPSFTVTANAGYTRSNTVAGTCPQGSFSGNVYSTGAINASCTVIFSASSNPPSAATLNGSISVAGSSYNLSSSGSSDWVHWGRGGTYANVDRKLSVNQISNVSVVGAGATVGAWTDASRSLSWSDGTPTASGTDDHGYIWSNANVATAGTTGFSFTAPADTSTRTLYVYAGGKASTSQLTAHLSDNSAADYTASPVTGASTYANLYTITYKAASASQNLVLTYKKIANSSSTTSGSADLIAAWLVGGSAPPPPPTGNGLDAFGLPIPPQSPTVAVAASNYLDSLGLYFGLPKFGMTYQQYAQMFNYLGIRNGRGCSADVAAPSCKDFGDYAKATYGIKLKFIWGLSGVSTTASIDVAANLNAAKVLAQAGYLRAFEGPNEPDTWAIVYNGVSAGKGNSWNPIGSLMKDASAAAQADSALKNIPFFSPTHIGNEMPNVGLQFLTIPNGANSAASAAGKPLSFPDGTHFSDFANMHNYVIWKGAPAPVDNIAWYVADPVGHVSPAQEVFNSDFISTWARGYAGYTPAQAPSVPRVTTETGWWSDSGGQEAQGKTLLNVIVAQFIRGYSQTYIYSSNDAAGGVSSERFGLYAGVGLGSPKLAAGYLHNFTTILADTVNSFTPGSLNWSIPSQPPTVHGLLLQKAAAGQPTVAGHFFLVVTDEHWPAKTDNITVNLGGTFATVNVYDPTTGTNVVKTVNNASSIALTMTDHPLIIEIVR